MFEESLSKYGLCACQTMAESALASLVLEEHSEPSGTGTPGQGSQALDGTVCKRADAGQVLQLLINSITHRLQQDLFLTARTATGVWIPVSSCLELAKLYRWALNCSALAACRDAE